MAKDIKCHVIDVQAYLQFKVMFVVQHAPMHLIARLLS